MKPKQVKSWKQDTVPESRMIMRFVSVRAGTMDEATHSVQVVIASENPVERYDEERQDVVSEILLMDGVRFRTDKRQLPIVDSHDRSTVRNVLGSVRNLRTEGTELVGDAMFAADAEPQIAFQKLLDGHLTDFSITATPRSIQRIKRGESYNHRGTELAGPVDLVSEWMPTDASLVAAGADSTSTVRSELMRAYSNPHERLRQMNEDLKQALSAMGMPSEIETSDGALIWMIAQTPPQAEEVEMADEPTPPEEETEEEAPVENAVAEPVAVIANADDEKEEVEMADRAEIETGLIKRHEEIRSLCKSASISREFADGLCVENVSLETAREKVLERMINKPLGTGESRVSVVGSAHDKFTDAVRDGLISRAIPASGTRRGAFEGTTPAEGYQDFAQMPMLRMAEEILRRGQINTSRMTPRDIAMVAMGDQGTCNRLRIQRAGEAYHTTGTFSNLLLDASNKSLQNGYEEAPFTWNMWARQAPSVPDFKTIHRVKFSESPDLQVVPENKDYPEAVHSDEREFYSVAKYGTSFTVTWETVVNDDLDALSRIPANMGTAARRKQNQVCYATLTDNATMNDGGALFNATAITTAGGHANLAGSGAAISETTLNAAYLAMMKQTGVNTGVTINVIPRYLIVPAAISATAIQTTVSLTPPTVGGNSDGTSNVVNLYGPGGPRQLQVIVDPVLDGNSATIWYLAADNRQVDTVELTFLQGEETPVIETEWDFNKDGWKHKVRQTFAAAAIDYRGLYSNPGA